MIPIYSIVGNKPVRHKSIPILSNMPRVTFLLAGTSLKTMSPPKNIISTPKCWTFISPTVYCIRFVIILWALQQVWPSNLIGDYLMCLAIANKDNCHFRFWNQSWDTKFEGVKVKILLFSSSGHIGRPNYIINNWALISVYILSTKWTLAITHATLNMFLPTSLAIVYHSNIGSVCLRSNHERKTTMSSPKSRCDKCTIRARFHVLVSVHFLKNKWVEGWKKGGAMWPSPSSKGWYPTWMGVPHYMLCKNGRQRTNNPHSQEKDMCWLESSSD